MVYFKGNYNFLNLRFKGGPTFSRGWSPTLSRVGDQLLIPMKTYVIFQRRSRPPSGSVHGFQVYTYLKTCNSLTSVMLDISMYNPPPQFISELHARLLSLACNYRVRIVWILISWVLRSKLIWIYTGYL